MRETERENKREKERAREGGDRKAGCKKVK